MVTSLINNQCQDDVLHKKPIIENHIDYPIFDEPLKIQDDNYNLGENKAKVSQKEYQHRIIKRGNLKIT